MEDRRGRRTSVGEERVCLVEMDRSESDGSQKLIFPGAEEIQRRIVEIDLDLPWVFQTSENSRVKLLEKKEFLLKAQSTDITEGKLTSDEVMDNFIKAVMNSDMLEIKTMLNQDSKHIVFETLLKFNQKVNLKDDKAKKSVSSLEIFMDIFQFVVIQDKPEVLQVMLKEVGDRSQEELHQLLATNLIRLNSIDEFHMKQFEYEDVKLEKQDILHLAANGNNGCLKVLLDSSLDMPVSVDSQKRTIMHIAASNPSNECLDTIYTFVKDKDEILKQDTIGYTPLHYAVKYGKLETVILILSKLPNVSKDIADGNGINAKNKKGKTALFYAKDSHMMYLLLHFGADPCIISEPKGESVLESYMRTDPENAIALINYDVATNVRDTTDKEFVYTYNFRLLLNKEKVASDEGLDEVQKMDKIDVMAKFMETQESSWKLLNAPIAEFYLRLKWNMFRKFYFLNLIFFLAYLLSLTTLTTWTSYKKNHQEGLNNANITTAGCYSGGFFANQVGFGWMILYILTSACTLPILLREMIEFASKGTKHFKTKENWFQFFILTVSVAYLILLSISGDYICAYEQYLGSLTLLLAWIEMTFMIGRIPSVRIYIIMSYKVFKQLITVFSFYSTTMFAFACAYTIILPQSIIFENLLTSSIKVIVMMIGELDFEANFIWDSRNSKQTSLTSKILTQGIFIGVMFMVSMTLNNLIIGLTVENIGELQKEARSNMPNKTIEQIKKTEDLFKKNWFAEMAVKFLVKSAECWQNVYASSNSMYVLTPKDIVNCKKEFQVCVQRDFNKDLHDSSHVMYSYFDVYIYDEENKKKGKKVNMEIPEWIVKNTEKALDERKKIFDDLGEEFEKFRKAQRTLSELRRFGYNNSFTSISQNDGPLLQDATFAELLDQMEKFKVKLS